MRHAHKSLGFIYLFKKNKLKQIYNYHKDNVS